MDRSTAALKTGESLATAKAIMMDKTINRQSIIEARGVSKVYRRGSEEICALQDIDLDIQKGEFVSIVGPSGSGKTALLNAIGCLDRPTSGSLRLNGVETVGMKESELVQLRRENIGFVFQQFYLLPTLTARDNIELPLLFSRKKLISSRINEILEMVGLSGRGDHLPGQLSGGEMQRVAIGRAMVNEPAIILADEPTGNLDSLTSERIYGLFRELNDQGLTLVVVTHNPELAVQADTTCTIRDGRIT